MECKSGDDWVSVCKNVVVGGLRCVGRGRKTWGECVKDDTDELGLHPEWVVAVLGFDRVSLSTTVVIFITRQGICSPVYMKIFINI